MLVTDHNSFFQEGIEKAFDEPALHLVYAYVIGSNIHAIRWNRVKNMKFELEMESTRSI